MEPQFVKVATPQIGDEEVAAVREVLLSGNFVSGKKVAEFEKRFAEYIGVKHAIAVNSGTAALYIALEALGIKEGDEVVVPPLTFFATVSAVMYLRAVPVFADIDLDDFCLSPASVKDVITSRTKAIVPVHLFGAAAKMDDLRSIANQHGLSIIEDCAQAHGTEYTGRKVGGIGNAGAFSFFATKHMTTGEGGIITTNDDNAARLSRILRNHGMTDRDSHEYLGFNSRMTEIEAAMGLVQLKKLEGLNRKRIENSEYLIHHLGKLPWAKLPLPDRKMRHTYFWCPFMINAQQTSRSLEDLKDHLEKNHIGYRSRYQEPLYKQPAFTNRYPNYRNIHLKNVESVAGKIIGLPNHPGLKKNELKRIIDVIRSFRA